MKNYEDKDQKLPMFGIGPYLIAGVAAVALAGVLLSGNALRSGIVEGAGKWVMRAAGVLLMLCGAAVWFTGAVRSGMDDHIIHNKLKTDGIYAWVRNPMYSGVWMILLGIVQLWHNLWLLAVIPLTWGILTVVLKRTEERWLTNVYGEAYTAYCQRVNRLIPWFPKK